LIGNVEPLLNDVQNGGLVKEVELLTKALNEAMIDVKTLNESVLTPDNRQQLQESISTLTKTLKNIEVSL
jgi:Spy/CpxP family protein refolding chaperone